MKYYKNIGSFIKQLKHIQKQPVSDLRGVDRLTEEQISALVEITAFISNMFGDELCEFDI